MNIKWAGILSILLEYKFYNLTIYGTMDDLTQWNFQGQVASVWAWPRLGISYLRDFD